MESRLHIGIMEEICIDMMLKMAKRIIDASGWNENLPSQTVYRPSSAPSITVQQQHPNPTRIVKTYRPPFPRVIPQPIEHIVDEEEQPEEEITPVLKSQPHLSGLDIKDCTSIELAYEKNKEKIRFRIE